MSTSVPIARRSVAGRATLALALLLGFYALAFGLGGLLLWLNLAMLGDGRVNPRILIFSAIVLVALARGIFFVERGGDEAEVGGVELTEANEPRLWGLVREIAAELQTEPPKRIYLTPDVNAFVFQRSKLMGLVAGDRVMGIGMPLLDVMTVDELRGVLAHEFGHYTGGDTRLGPIVYRGRASIGRTIDHLGDNLLGGLFRGYGKVYMRVSQAVSRRQELAADTNAAMLAGAAAHASALRKVHLTAPVFSAFLDRYVGPLLDAGARPRDLYAGFHEFRTHPDWRADIERLAEENEREKADPYDSHPSLGQRLALLGAAANEPAPDSAPAETLLADPAARRAELSDLFTRLVSGKHALRAVDWDDDAATAMVMPAATRERDRLLKGLRGITGGNSALSDALDLLASGRVDDLATAAEPGVREVKGADRPTVARQVAGSSLYAAIAAELVRDHGCRFALRWNRSAELVAPDGSPVDLDDALDAALDGPDGVPVLRQRLLALGLAA